MDQYIQALINSEPRVNIPGFGAFLVAKDKGGKILFNQYLNFDDGILSKYIVENKGITKEQADREIAEYVSNLKTRLDAGEEVSIGGIGKFIKESSGLIQFTVDADAPSQPSGIVLDFEPTQQSNNEQNNEQTVIRRSPVTDNAEEPKAEEPKEKTETAKEPEKQSYTKSEEKTEEPKTAAGGTTININNEQNYTGDDGNRKRTILIIVLIVLLFLIGAFICLFIINKDNGVYRFFCGEEEVVIPAPIVEPVDTTTVVEPDTIIAEPEPVEVERRYDIIVGTYKTESAAEARCEKLRAKGFNDAFVSTFRGNYVAVIESHTSLVEAESRQEYIVDNYRIESYITNGGE